MVEFLYPHGVVYVFENSKAQRVKVGMSGIRTAPRDHMQISFQHRRKGIVGDCRQMKVDVDSYNEAHPDAELIQIVFDFTMDLAELEAAEDEAA
jgi:hypothetical protein